jgi:hypothetical protein
MSIVVNNKRINVPGLHTTCWLDDPSIKYITDKNPRERWLRAIVAHTIHGKSGKLLSGFGPNTDIDTRNARYQVNTAEKVSWDFTEDLNGEWLIQNDPLKDYSWQATSVNPITCGFEMVQLDNGDLYEGQIQQAVLFIDALTAILGIQRQIPWDKRNNRPVTGVIDRISGSSAGTNVVGIYGHRNQTTNRGKGDPGDFLFIALKDAGYELFDFDAKEDLNTWKQRQANLGLVTSDIDGVSGQKTVAALKAQGHKHGLWVKRPVDDLLVL